MSAASPRVLSPSPEPARPPRKGNRPGRVALGALSAVALVSGLLGATAASAVTKDQSPYAPLGQLARVLVLVENNYVEPVDRSRVLEGAIKGMVAELDPHSAFLPPEDFKLFRSETEGAFGGVGIEVDARRDTITVIAPIDGSPAARAGIRSGDRIVMVDGKPTRGVPLERIVRTMRGAPGTKVRLTVQRPGRDLPLEFDLTREIVRVTSVVGRRLDGDIGYLRVKQFQQGTHDEFLRVLGSVRAQSPAPLAGVVLDLRSNPGGLVDEASAVADDLLDQGTIYTTRHRGRVVEQANASRGGPLARTPIVVLVNEYSASAAELVAGAVQDHKRGVVVGAMTYGKGSVQSILDLPGGAGLKLTTMLYFTPSGRSVQAEGIHPDVVIASGAPSPAATPILRERDVEGHIPGATPHPADAGATSETTADAATAAPDPFDIPRDVPANPTQGKDPVLSVGYQIVRGNLSVNAARPQPSR